MPRMHWAACICAANCTANAQCAHWHFKEGTGGKGQPGFPWICDLRTSDVWAGEGTCERDTSPAPSPPAPPGPPPPGPPQTMLSCNASALTSGSVITLTKKLDQSGSCGSSACPPANHWPCAIAGPDEGDAATIIMPPHDCALHAGGDITLSGRLTFVAGQAKDCCHDGEGHGSIMCTDSGGNITIAPGAVVTVMALGRPRCQHRPRWFPRRWRDHSPRDGERDLAAWTKLTEGTGCWREMGRSLSLERQSQRRLA